MGGETRACRKSDAACPGPGRDRRGHGWGPPFARAGRSPGEDPDEAEPRLASPGQGARTEPHAKSSCKIKWHALPMEKEPIMKGRARNVKPK